MIFYVTSLESYQLGIVAEIVLRFQILWTNLPCQNFHLLLCVAILDIEKKELMKTGNGFTEILKVCGIIYLVRRVHLSVFAKWSYFIVHLISF